MPNTALTHTHIAPASVLQCDTNTIIYTYYKMLRLKPADFNRLTPQFLS